MASVFSRLVVKNPTGVVMETLIFLLAVTGVLVMIVGSIVSALLSAATWNSLIGGFPGGIAQMGHDADGWFRLFFTIVGGLSLVVFSGVLSALYNLFLTPVLRSRNVARLEKRGFQADPIFCGQWEWSVLDPQQRYAFFLTAARALQIHADEIKKVAVRSMPLGRKHLLRVELTDPQTPYHEVYFKSKDEANALHKALREL